MPRRRLNSGLIKPVDTLALGQLKIDKVKVIENVVVLCVSSAYGPRTPIDLPTDQKTVFAGLAKRHVWDFPINDRPTKLRISRQAFRVGQATKRYSEHLSDIDETLNVTHRLKSAVAEAAIHSTFVDTAARYRIPEKLVRRIFVETADARLSSYKPRSSLLIGIDQTIIKRKKITCINKLFQEPYSESEIRRAKAIACKPDYDGKFLPELVEGGLKTRAVLLDTQLSSSLEGLLGLVSEWQDSSDVQAVCHDGADIWFKVTERGFPNAKSVLDKFHVIRLARHCLVLGFRQVAQSFSNPSVDLRSACISAVKGGPNAPITYDLQQCWKEFPDLITICQLYRSMIDVYHEPDFDCAFKALAGWTQHFNGSAPRIKSSFKALASLISKRRDNILNHFLFSRLTNGSVEERHRRYHFINAASRGIEMDMLRRKMLLGFGHVPSLLEMREITGMHQPAPNARIRKLVGELDQIGIYQHASFPDETETYDGEGWALNIPQGT